MGGESVQISQNLLLFFCYKRREGTRSLVFKLVAAATGFLTLTGKCEQTQLVTVGLLWLEGGVSAPEAPLVNVDGVERGLKMPELAGLWDPNAPLKTGTGAMSPYCLPGDWHKKLAW